MFTIQHVNNSLTTYEKRFKPKFYIKNYCLGSGGDQINLPRKEDKGKTRF